MSTALLPSPAPAMFPVRLFAPTPKAAAPAFVHKHVAAAAAKPAPVAAAARKSGADSAALAAPPASSLPPETRWVAAQSGSKTFETAVVELTELAGNLSRINGWLALPSPADDGGFPYHLVLYESKNPDATAPVVQGSRCRPRAR